MDVEQMLTDLQRGLNQRNLAHREQISAAMNGIQTALVRFHEALDRMAETEMTLMNERSAALAELQEQIRQHTSTLLLVRDMHPVLIEAPKKRNGEAH
jgi:hypothetical protein